MDALIQQAMRHPDKLGAGAKLRRKLLHRRQDVYAAIMAEFARGTLRSGSGMHVKNKAQALAIARSEARKRSR